MASAEAQFAEAEQKLTDAKSELADAKEKYASGKKEAQEKIADAEKEIQDAEDQLADVDYPEWYVLDRNSTQAYVEYEQNAERIGAIGKIFPLIFFLVAALVSLTTMTRMVESQRTEIGTLKCFGVQQLGHCQKICFLCLIGQSHRKHDRIGFGAEIAAMGYHCCLSCTLSEFVCGTDTAECLLFHHGIRSSCYLRDWCGTGVLLQRTGGITGGIGCALQHRQRTKDFRWNMWDLSGII